MPDLLTRRAYLLDAIRTDGRPVTTQLAAQLLADSPWPTAGRNTARKDLRALAAQGHLAPAGAEGRRAYTLKDCA
ncbi:hypothetical protein AB0N17_03370 [Streptomyces sp. NPDC051133]|uniref:hypothetical protein n=1 Tax=Streptomyces sp. NPDC051133 TaxID=3155521 RepID=UPI00343D9DD8